MASNVFIGGSPRFAMEALGMVLIALLAYGVSSQPGGVATALPVLGALALGAQRLLPSLQQIFNAWAIIAGSQASLENTIDLLDQPISNAKDHSEIERLHLKEDIRFSDVKFRYQALPAGPK